MNNLNSEHLKYLELMLEKTLNNKALAATLFKKLFNTLPNQVTLLVKHLNNHDIYKAKRLAHDIHGVVASCGFINLEYYTQSINHFLSINDLEKAQKFLQVLEDQTEILLGCQEKILASLEL